MQALEEWMFAQGLPVAALMERAGWSVAQAIRRLLPQRRIGVLVGSGHNGADALVVARELHQAGYSVYVYVVGESLKPLTAQHLQYYQALGGHVVDDVHRLEDTDGLIDGLFGIGLTRTLAGSFLNVVNWVNQVYRQGNRNVISIDIPSGIHSDTGEVLGSAIQATHTLCLGLWKRCFFQEGALLYCGEVALIDLAIPTAALDAIVPQPRIQVITPELAKSHLPLDRAITAHKYSVGKVLIVAGSRAFPGAALLAGLGAKASGVGLVAMAVPASIRDLLLPHLPDAVYYPCPETSDGAIAELTVNPQDFTAIVVGPGLTPCPDLVNKLIAIPVNLVLDADALNSLAPLTQQFTDREVILTPHVGEFRRLFPLLDPADRFTAIHAAAAACHATIVLKGARTVITKTETWVNALSTPALARAGSGDVLAGMIGGLLAQGSTGAALAAVWWHSHTARMLAAKRSVLGVDPLTLALNLNTALVIDTP
jgi:ADP-dependent NAD(P)H-hydrate dehydratase / NAD(P)H-hydrate epimerase